MSADDPAPAPAQAAAPTSLAPRTPPCSRPSGDCGSRWTHRRRTSSTACWPAWPQRTWSSTCSPWWSPPGTSRGCARPADPSAQPTGEPADGDEGSWSLEYAHAEFRVYLRLTRIEDRTRLDGWVVPSRPLTVRLLAEATEVPQETSVDEFGRFELPAAPSGLARLLLLDEPPTADRPRITPPFWI